MASAWMITVPAAKKGCPTLKNYKLGLKYHAISAQDAIHTCRRLSLIVSVVYPSPNSEAEALLFICHGCVYFTLCSTML